MSPTNRKIRKRLVAAGHELAPPADEPSSGGLPAGGLSAEGRSAAGGACLAFWFIREAIHRHLNRVRRPTHYAAERRRRLALARARRRQGRRATTNPRPSTRSCPARRRVGRRRI